MTSGFKSDSQGFLVGEIIENGRDLMRMQQQGIEIWKTIRADVKAIAHAVNAQVATTAMRMNRADAVPRPPSIGQRTLGGTRQAVVYPAGRSTPLQGASVSSRASAVVIAQPRAANGRFVAGQRPATPSNGDPGGVGDRDAPSVRTTRHLNDTLGKLASSFRGADNIDPTVNALKEVKDVVTPLGRGLFSLVGRTAERKKERWYRRFLKALTPNTQRDQQQRGGSGLLGGVLGGLWGILKSVPALLMLAFTRILAPIAAAWGSWELGKWIGGKIYEWLDASGWNTKLFDAIDAITGAFSDAWDSVSSGIDAVVNGIEGAWKMITDGFKSALDSFMEFPRRLGEFMSSLDDTMRGLPVIGKVYAKAADAVKGAAADAKAGYDEGANGKTDAPASSAVQAVGRDVGKAVNTVKSVGSQAGAGYDEAHGGKSDVPAPTDLVQRAARAVGGAAGGATGWVLGQTSKRYESGNGGAGTVSSGKGDHGGASYGTYQLSSKAGTLSKFLRQSSYGAQFAGLQPGTPEFNAKWKEVAKNDPNFGTAQHDFIRATHYDPMVARLKEDGIDIEGRGAGVKDAAWSTSVQFGGGSTLIQRALKGQDASTKMTDAQMITAIQNYKAAHNDSLFAKSSAAVRAGTLARAHSEKASLLSLDAGVAGRSGYAAVAAGPTLPAMASANVPSPVPVVIPKPTNPDERMAQISSGAGAGRGSINVTMPDGVGQNVSDRGIAHIVSGGLGASGGW